MTSRIVKLHISGAVQRVGFRMWTERQALSVGLEGWVRNRSDGSVECLLSGPADKVEELIDLCRRGPPRARVERIDVSEPDSRELDLRASGTRFDVLSTF